MGAELRGALFWAGRTAAITLAPPRTAICVAIDPTPPAAPCTNTTSPLTDPSAKTAR